MLRNIDPAPGGGLCVGYDPKFFKDATTEAEIAVGVSLCHQCPIFRECQRWAEKTVAEDNRDTSPDRGERIPLKGVVAGRYYVPTDYRGVPISIRKITEKSSLNVE